MKRGVFGFAIGCRSQRGESACPSAPYRGIAQNAAHGQQSPYRARRNRRRRASSPRRAALAARQRRALARRPSGAHVVRPWPSDRPVPPLDLVDLDGKRWRLEALAGKVVVLNFWATWCKPCRIEMPSLAAMAAQRRRDGVVVAAVNYLEAAEKIRSYLEQRAVQAADPARQRRRRDGRLDAARLPEHGADRPRRPAGADRRRRARLARRRGAEPARAAGRGAAQGLAIGPRRGQARTARPARRARR